MKKLNDNNYLTELNKQMVAFDASSKYLTLDDINYGIELFAGMGIIMTEDILRNALAEYVLSGNKELLSIGSYENFSVWYIGNLKHFIEMYPNVTVSDITWLQMLCKENKIEMTRENVYLLIEDYYSGKGNTLSMNKTIGKSMLEQYLKDNKIK